MVQIGQRITNIYVNNLNPLQSHLVHYVKLELLDIEHVQKDACGNILYTWFGL